MIVDILTIFPNMFGSPFSESIIKRAQDKNLVKINIHNLRDWSTDNYKSVDDRPFGGGPGMIMRVDIIDRAITDLKEKAKSLLLQRGQGIEARREILPQIKVVLLDTKAPFYTQQKAQELSNIDHLILIAPHFEGIDHRVHEYIADEVISIGPYVLTGGELPTMVVIDSIVRLLPGAIKEDSLKDESYSKVESRIKNQELSKKNNSPLVKESNQSKAREEILLTTNFESPQYTRPAEFKGWKVPDILLSGNHKEIEKWRNDFTY